VTPSAGDVALAERAERLERRRAKRAVARARRAEWMNPRAAAMEELARTLGFTHKQAEIAAYAAHFKSGDSYEFAERTARRMGCHRSTVDRTYRRMAGEGLLERERARQNEPMPGAGVLPCGWTHRRVTPGRTVEEIERERVLRYVQAMSRGRPLRARGREKPEDASSPLALGATPRRFKSAAELEAAMLEHDTGPPATAPPSQ